MQATDTFALPGDFAQSRARSLLQQLLRRSLRAGDLSLRERERQHLTDVVRTEHAHQQAVHAQRDTCAIGHGVQHGQQVFVQRQLAQAAFAAARVVALETRCSAASFNS